MSETLLAGLPRIVRAFEELRLRGALAVAVGLGAASWWVVQWLLDQPTEPARTWTIALVVVGLGAISVAFNVPRRLRAGLGDPRFPNARVVYETRADGRVRRVQLSGAVFLTVIMVLTFDVLAQWGGVTAGIVTALGLVTGAADIVEGNLWRRAERERRSELYLLVPARALAAGYGRLEVYEVPPDVAEREREHGPFTL